MASAVPRAALEWTGFSLRLEHILRLGLGRGMASAVPQAAALAVAKCYTNPQSLFINLEGMAKLSDHSVSGLNHG